MNQTIVGFNAI